MYLIMEPTACYIQLTVFCVCTLSVLINTTHFERFLEPSLKSDGVTISLNKKEQN